MQRISPKKLKLNEETLALYGETDNTTLKLSISLLGILEPLIVYKRDEADFFQIVSGNRRLKVALELGMNEVPMLEIEPIEIDTLISVGHNEQRIKLPSHYIKEYRAYNELYNLKQGSRNPESKKHIQQRNQLFSDIKKSSMDRLISIDKIANELADGNEDVYIQLINELDNTKKIDGVRKQFLNRLHEKKNREVIDEKYEYKSLNATIFNKSSDKMEEVADNSVSVIVTSPPYFNLRDYKNGEGQLGHEVNEDVFVNRLVNHFRESKRVLKKDGTLWVNLGDFVVHYSYRMIPEKFTIEMMKDGWIVHDKIIWLKNNPMWTGGSRSVVAHEYIYVFKLHDFVNYDFNWLCEQDVSDGRYVYGVNSKKLKLRSVFDFRDGVVTTNGANNFKLKEYCEKAGIHLTHSATFPIAIPTIAIFTTTKELDLVVDPFNGTATTGRSALLFQRSYIGYDLNPTYIKQSEVRLTMPTNEDIEELGVVLNYNLLFDQSKTNGELVKITNKRNQDFNLDEFVTEGYTVLSLFPI